jgi:hypothetical protein
MEYALQLQYKILTTVFNVAGLGLCIIFYISISLSYVKS